MKKLWLMIAAPVLLAACGGSGNVANTSNANAGNGNAPSANSAPANTNIPAPPTATSFALPSPKAVENGKPQSYTGITITVPTDWKATGKKDMGTASGIGFQSPGSEAEAMTLYVGRSYQQQAGDMVAEFAKMRKGNPALKSSMPAVDGTIGILSLAESSYGDSLTWETFVPPDAKGYAVNRHIKFSFPAGKFEQNKQQIADILHSAKIQQ
jgi:hypothetical protein